MAFTAADVKTLREMTSVGMMDCKKALVECDGDMDKAVEWLREKGLAKAAKKAGRIAAEGMSYAADRERRGRRGRGQLRDRLLRQERPVRGLRQGHRQGHRRAEPRRCGRSDELQVCRLRADRFRDHAREGHVHR